MSLSRLYTLEAGPGWGMTRPLPRSGVIRARSQAPAARTPGMFSRLFGLGSGPVSEHAQHMVACALNACETPREGLAAGPAYTRLAALVLSHKLSMGDHVGPGARARMLRDARLPGYLYANPATQAIFAAPAEGLGKGGFIGKITSSFNRAIKPVSQVLTAATSTITSTVAGGIQDLGGTVSGLDNAASRGVTGLANQAANFASSRQGLSTVLDAATGGGIGAIAGGVDQYGASAGSNYSGPLDSNGMPVTTPKAAGAGVSSSVLLVGALALGALFLFSGSSRRR
jgi:hypothetical protein